jgi:hypothetical protein
MVRPNSLESGFPGKRDEPIRAGITAIVFIIVGYSYLAFINYGRAFHPTDGNC